MVELPRKLLHTHLRGAVCRLAVCAAREITNLWGTAIPIYLTKTTNPVRFTGESVYLIRLFSAAV